VAGFLVERYLPGTSGEGIRAALARVSAAATELEAEGTPVAHLGSTYIRSEETCLCRFESTSPDIVAVANERAAFPFARILLVEHLPATKEPTGATPLATQWNEVGGDVNRFLSL
jgi:hypothetical protein